MKALCSIEGCGNRRKTRGWCNKHYLRWWHHGDPLADHTRPPARLQWLLATVAAASTDDCIEWPFGGMSSGYGYVQVDGQNRGAHRVACEQSHGPAPTPRHEAAHSCGRRSCVNPRHLRWATHTENQADRLIHGTTNRGERYGKVKLTESKVREIRRRFAEGVRQQELAAEYGVSQVTISNVVTRYSWSWLH